MELTGKQRAQLRAMANELEPIVHIGKEGITEAVVKQTSAASPAPSRCRSSARNSCSIARRTPSPRKSASRS